MVGVHQHAEDRLGRARVVDYLSGRTCERMFKHRSQGRSITGGASKEERDSYEEAGVRLERLSMIMHVKHGRHIETISLVKMSTDKCRSEVGGRKWHQ